MKQLKHWMIIVPARLESTRLPRKPLADLAGKPLIVRVAENLKPLIERGAKAIVATDSAEVREVCIKEGINAHLTSPLHASGTDRCHEVVQDVDKSHVRKFILNVQGDEPFIQISTLEKLKGMFSTF